MSESPRRLQVAVGIVFRDDGAVLLGQRLVGKPYAGWWEFPGGKIEAGESVEQALARELHEELGLTVRSSTPWVVRDHVYPHASVRLHFYRVTDWSGTPESREGQQFVWQQPNAIDVTPMLPAALPVIAWLQLPQHIVRLDPERPVDWSHRFEGMAGDAMLLLDCASSDARVIESRLAALQVARREFGRIILLGAPNESSFGDRIDGVVWSASQLKRTSGRPSERWVGAMVADLADLERAVQLGIDFVVLDRFGSPLPFNDWRGRAQLPVFVSDTDLGRAHRYGAHGIIS